MVAWNEVRTLTHACMKSTCALSDRRTVIKTDRTIILDFDLLSYCRLPSMIHPIPSPLTYLLGSRILRAATLQRLLVGMKYAPIWHPCAVYVAGLGQTNVLHNLSLKQQPCTSDGLPDGDALPCAASCPDACSLKPSSE